MSEGGSRRGEGGGGEGWRKRVKGETGEEKEGEVKVEGKEVKEETGEGKEGVERVGGKEVEEE